MIDKNSFSDVSPSSRRLEQITGAFLGAATGDALGWPFEGHSYSPIDKGKWQGDFFYWYKKSGSRFRPTIEYVASGEYSDDTQLILALARSRQETNEWWIDFATCELPFWTSYERGGGGATKRAAATWLTGGAPWSSDNDTARKYFAAGGNGVAMRILPHCVFGLDDVSYQKTATDIITDAVITHGHPRAIVGALAYGFALWYVLRLNGTLKFGEVIDATIENVNVWGELFSVEERWPGWKLSALKSSDYENVWKATILEMLDLLCVTKNAIQAGALSFDEEILSSIGAIGTKISGAGTVSAAAAIYFASRYAADPLEGIRRAASATGSDTDTIASMSGALLGALSGKNWLRTFIPHLQDHAYIESIGTSLASKNIRASVPRPSIGRTDLARLSKTLSSANISVGLDRLPNWMAIETVKLREGKDVPSPNFSARWQVVTSEGVSFYFKVSASSAKAKTEEKKIENVSSRQKNQEIYQNIIGISLAVSNLEASKTFYENILGLSISGETPKTIRFGSGLALREEPFNSSHVRNVKIFLQTYDLNGLHKKMLKFGYPFVYEIVEKSQRRSFECADPDGYIVEVVENRKTD